MTRSCAYAIDLDGALADTHPLWRDWLESAAGVLGVSPSELPQRRDEAAAELDLRAGNWRTLLERFCEDRIAVYVRRDPVIGEALRALSAAGCELGVYTDAPEELARLALAQIGADRRVSVLAAGSGAREAVLDTLGPGTVVVSARAELAAAAKTTPSAGSSS